MAAARKRGKAKPKKRAGPGRPSRWTQQVQDAIVELVKAGDAAEVAAGVNGVPRSTHFQWLAARDDYRTAVSRARDVFESTSRAVVLGGDEKGEGFGPARARLEVLSRRVPSRWSPTMKVEMADQLNRFLDAAQRICSPADFEKLLEELAEEPGGGETSGSPL